MTSKEAAQKWVAGFNAIQRGMIEKLIVLEPESWHEVTVPAVGDRVYVYSESESGEIIAREKQFLIKFDDGKKLLVAEDDIEIERYYQLPMWGTMWSFNDSLDRYWLEEDEGKKLMSDCGFRIFKSDEFGYFFGIDGAGYDFYEAHWIPLYKARGLNWHEA